MGCWSCRLSRKRQASFGAGRATYWRVPRSFHRISDRRTSRSVSSPIALFVHPLSSVSCTVDRIARRFAIFSFQRSRTSHCGYIYIYIQDALPALYPRGLDGKSQLSPTGGYELKVLFNGAHRQVSALSAVVAPISHPNLSVDH